MLLATLSYRYRMFYFSMAGGSDLSELPDSSIFAGFAAVCPFPERAGGARRFLLRSRLNIFSGSVFEYYLCSAL